MAQIQPSLFRKRFIPSEIIHLKDDTILKTEDHLIVTSWRTLKPRADIARGISAYFIAEGFKVSKIYDKEDNLVYWYCDIINTVQNLDDNSICFEDLLIDVIVYPDGKLKVLDADELADAFEAGLISRPTLCYVLRTMNRLLSLIDSGAIAAYQQVVEDCCKA